MKPYRDAFGNPLPKKDVELAAIVAARSNTITPMKLATAIGHIGIFKAKRMIMVLIDAGVIIKSSEGVFNTILTNENSAVNAALRQLKKGRSNGRGN